jgi:hypothetical protein
MFLGGPEHKLKMNSSLVLRSALDVRDTANVGCMATKGTHRQLALPCVGLLQTACTLTTVRTRTLRGNRDAVSDEPDVSLRTASSLVRAYFQCSNEGRAS